MTNQIETLAAQMNTDPKTLIGYLDVLRPIVLRFIEEGATPEQAVETALVKVAEYIESLKTDENFICKVSDDLWEEFNKA